MNSRHFRFFLVFIMFIMCFSFISCRKKQIDVPKEKITIALSNAILTAPIIVAQKLGYFKEVGLDVTYLDGYASGKAAFQDMLKGKADISTVATTPVVFHGFDRHDYNIFVTYTTSVDGVKIIGRIDRGISMPPDLIGKRIGIVKGTISQFLLLSFLAYNKILASEVTMVEYKGSQLPEMLRKGEVDAIAVWDPHAYNAMKGMEGVFIRFDTSRIHRQAIVFSVMNDYADNNPGKLEKVIKALNMAVTYMKKNEDQVVEILATELEMELELTRAIYYDYKFELSLDQVLLYTMEEEARWAIKYLFDEERDVPNFLDFIDSRHLKNVFPDKVSIIGTN